MTAKKYLVCERNEKACVHAPRAFRVISREIRRENRALTNKSDLEKMKKKGSKNGGIPVRA